MLYSLVITTPNWLKLTNCSCSLGLVTQLEARDCFLVFGSQSCQLQQPADHTSSRNCFMCCWHCLCMVTRISRAMQQLRKWCYGKGGKDFCQTFHRLTQSLTASPHMHSWPEQLCDKVTMLSCKHWTHLQTVDLCHLVHAAFTLTVFTCCSALASLPWLSKQHHVLQLQVLLLEVCKEHKSQYQKLVFAMLLYTHTDSIDGRAC